MYNYNFKTNNETIIKEATNINIKFNNSYYLTNFILTEKNLLVFYDVNKGNPIWGSGTQPLPDFYLLFSIPTNNINYKIMKNNLYILLNNQIINCYNFNLENFLK